MRVITASPSRSCRSGVAFFFYVVWLPYQVESWYRAGEPGRGATVQTDSRVDCGKALPGHRMRAGKNKRSQYSIAANAESINRFSI